MGTSEKSTNTILHEAQETLLTAKLGLEDVLHGTPVRRMTGLRNLIVFGRAVTNVLQNLRSTEPSFDDWYVKYKEEMQNDPLMRFFYKLRSEILKEGTLRVGTQTFVSSFSTNDLTKYPRPAGAVSFFFGDHIGGSGWIVQLPDGSEEKYYIEIPPDIVQSQLLFPHPPTLHLGQELKSNSVEHLSELYISYLEKLVRGAKLTFKKP